MSRFLGPTPSVLCVDDNREVADAVRESIARAGGFLWCGWLPDASKLMAHVALHHPSITLLDIDMPGPGSFEALKQLSGASDTRVIMFSANVTRQLVHQAIEDGAWGYFLKSDGVDSLLQCLRRVAHGEFGLSPEPARLYNLI